MRHLAGVKDNEGVMEVETEGGLGLVFNDILMNVPKVGFPQEMFMGPSGRVAIPRFARWFFVKDKAALRADLQALNDRAPARLVPGHGADVTEDVAEKLKEAITLI